MASSTATRGVTVTCALPSLPSTAAVIVACPTARAVTRPFEETLAMPGAPVDQATVLPVIAVPF